jgi:hypothetical protein
MVGGRLSARGLVASAAIVAAVASLIAADPADAAGSRTPPRPTRYWRLTRTIDNGEPVAVCDIDGVKATQPRSPLLDGKRFQPCG